jgi:hypothetical protein
MQKYKELKVEMYKPICGLMFKCNGSGIQFNLIQFLQEYSNQRNTRKENKRSNKYIRCNGVRLKNVYVSETLNRQQLRLSRNIKNSFTLVELGPLHKNGLPNLSVTRVTTHSKIRNEWQHTQKGVSTTAQEGFTRRSRRIKLGE